MGHALLCDFGLSRILDGLASGHTSHVQGGTLRYLAPELLGGSGPNGEVHPTPKSDVFAFACTCIQVSGMRGYKPMISKVQCRPLQVLFDHQPYHWHTTDYLVMRAIERNEAPWKWGDSPLERILTSCCCKSDSDRPSMSRFMAILSARLPNY